MRSPERNDQVIFGQTLNLDFFKHDDNRRKAEGYLNQREEEPIVYDWKDTQLPDELKKTWANVTQLRNDVLHVGFNESPRKINTVIEQNKTILKLLESVEEQIMRDTR
jgi:hypothetical protein